MLETALQLEYMTKLIETIMKKVNSVLAKNKNLIYKEYTKTINGVTYNTVIPVKKKKKRLMNYIQLALF